MTILILTLALLALAPLNMASNISTTEPQTMLRQTGQFPSEPGVSITDAAQTRSVSFTLLNGSLKSIPLKIPGYMNPNLSPESSSGVTLEVGQKVFFMYKSKKRLLLTVTEDLDGQKLLVDELIEERKAAFN